MSERSYSGYDDGAFVAEFYDHVPPYRSRDDIDFFVNLARDCGGDVLEVACGTGRVLIPTARAGVTITGLDYSEYMLAECERRLIAEPEEVRSRTTLVRADMRDFDLGRTFSLITMPFRPFQHLGETEEQMACLRTCRDHLEPGGHLLLDVFNPNLKIITDTSRESEHGDEPQFILPDGRTVLRRARVFDHDYANQRFRCELIYYVVHPDGREERLVHSFGMRYLFRWEAEHLLARCGFEVVEVFGSYDRRPFASDSPELIVLARNV
ncbi:class I SAM-dependent methyltransferase [bacterium]|nr:class I SAM-dependent methyltransferase [bacterium]MCB2201523.1 class I SAM-dependent methyltransferase [bacterium]